MIQKEFIKDFSVNDLIPYERNPRKIPQSAIDDVKESYRQCGVIDPIEIDEENVILSGHTRRLAALDLHIKTVDVLRVTGLSEEIKRKYRILANKTGEKSTWDFELLEWELEDLDFEGYDFGFEQNDFEADFEETDLDSAKEKNNVIASINCGVLANYEQIKDRLQELSDEIDGTLAVKMQ